MTVSRAVVIDTRGAGRAYLADGEQVTARPLAPDSLASLGVLLDRAADFIADPRSRALGRRDQGTLYICTPEWRSWAAQLGDGKVSGAHWGAVGITRWGPASSGWITFRDSATYRPDIHVALSCLVDPGKTPLFHPQYAGHVIAAALAWYHGATGAPWHMTAGVSGCAALRNCYPSRKRGAAPYWGVGVRGQIADPRTMAGDLAWERRMTDAETACAYVHAFDMVAARLAAANVADVPWESLEHDKNGRPFDETRAGYWKVADERVPRATGAAPPLFPRERGYKYLTTPIMRDLCRFGINPDVFESYTAHSSRWLLTWAKALDAARLEAVRRGLPEYETAIKDTYKRTVGMMMREGGSLFMPWVAHTVIDRQRVTLIGRARQAYDKAGLWPFKAVTDCLYYASDERDPYALGAQLGLRMYDPHRNEGQLPRLGMFRHYATVPMAEWLNGRRK